MYLPSATQQCVELHAALVQNPSKLNTGLYLAA